MRTEERDPVLRSTTGKHSPHSVAEAATGREGRSRTRVLLSVVEAFCFVLHFLLSSNASPVLRTSLKWGFTHPALLWVLLEPLGCKEAAEMEGAQS